MKRFGTEYAGFFYPSSLAGLDSSSVIYCVGAGEDISHDISLAKETGASVHIFDPTPRAIQHIELVKSVLKGGSTEPNKRYGGGDPFYWDYFIDSHVVPNKVHGYPWGIYTESKTMKFYLPSNPEYVSCSVVEGMKGNSFMEVEVKTLKETMSLLGHDHIDLLKLDIEGCECDVLEQMMEYNIFPKYLAVDFDLGWTGEKIRNPQRCFNTIDKLKTKGYSILKQKGPEWSFVRTN
jgi:hypothetical protein